jgi:hypothetical protein
MMIGLLIPSGMHARVSAASHPTPPVHRKLLPARRLAAWRPEPSPRLRRMHRPRQAITEADDRWDGVVCRGVLNMVSGSLHPTLSRRLLPPASSFSLLSDRSGKCSVGWMHDRDGDGLAQHQGPLVICFFPPPQYTVRDESTWVIYDTSFATIFVWPLERVRDRVAGENGADR